ncbi:MAG: tetratricopeptide repeat protein [Candidatus Latescibacteria bacterium]|nr:tetratricopeptide repeat protein [Candidatus Latescibacterota bacterium]
MNVDIRKLKRTVKREPTSLRFALLADQHRIAGDVEKAIQVCQAGLAWHPRYATGYCTLAQCHADQADLAEAKEALLDALRFAPDRLIALKQLADILKSEGDTTRALSYYRRALAIDPLDASIQAEITTLSGPQPPASAERPPIPFPSQPVPYSEVVDPANAAAWGTWVAGLFQDLVPQEDTATDGATPDSTTLWPGPAFEALLTLAEEATISPETPVTEFEAPASVIVEASPVEQDVIVPEPAVPPPDELTPASELAESAPATVDETPPSSPVIEETESIPEPAVEPFLSHAMDDSAMMRPEEEVVPGTVEPVEFFAPFSEPAPEPEPVFDIEPLVPAAPVVPETPAVPEAAVEPEIVVEPEIPVEPERLVEAEVPVEPEVSPFLAPPPVAETPEMMETLAAPEPTAPVLSTDRYLDQFFLVEGAEPPFRPEASVPAAPSPAPSPVAPVAFTVPAEEEVAALPARDADAESDEPAEPESHSDVIPTATLAELYVRQGLIDRAIAVYLSLIEKDPTNLDIHNRLSELFVIKAQQPKIPAP